MQVFVAGASGAIGMRLVPQLLDHGHHVIGTATTPASAERVRGLGAEAIILDLLDRNAVRRAVVEGRPDAIVHEATALANQLFSRNLDRTFRQTNRLRTEGTDALLAAAGEAGVRRFVAQSYANARYARKGGWIKSEDDPIDPNPIPSTRETNAAMRYLERAVGDGAGVTSFIHLDDAAAATVIAVEGEHPGIFNIVDDEPATVAEWLPALAEVLGADPPRHVPRWLARLIAGEAAVMMQTESRGASNARAKRELAWTLRYPSWRAGFVATYGATSRKSLLAIGTPAAS
jgi:nucleoside-diphosphate-sugar epimerase